MLECSLEYTKAFQTQLYPLTFIWFVQQKSIS